MRKVRCYWNLHRNCWSVQDARTRKVIGHAAKVLLRDVTFTVSAAGRERVLREGRKNVHAFACGTLAAVDWLDGPLSGSLFMCWGRGDQGYARYAMTEGDRVSYNPRRADHFEAHPYGKRVDNAPMALLGIQMGKAALYAFDPCNMTAAESAAATV
jgi:hypothetical protein